MQIDVIDDVNCKCIITDQSEFNEYYRFSKDSWYVWMGDSLEPYYNCEDIEKLYQEELKNF